MPRLTRRVAGAGGASPEGANRTSQLNVPCSREIGEPIGMSAGTVENPPSQQGPGAGPHAGPQGSQTGPQGAAIGGGHSLRLQGERNSIKEGRRQLPPMQLLQPGAAARAARASARHPNRIMTNLSERLVEPGKAPTETSDELNGVVRDATEL